jgi:ribonuclease R
MIAEKLLAAVDGAKGRPLLAKQLAAAAGLHPGEITQAKRVLRELVREGVLVREGKRFVRSATPAPAVEATEGPVAVSPYARRRGGEPEEEPAGIRGRGSRARGAVAVSRGRGRPGREVVGILTRRPEGFGFVRRISGPEGDDVFLPPHETRFALDGDTVRIELVPGKFGRDAGRLLEVVERRRRHVIGVYRAAGRDAYVQPADPALPSLVPVPRFRGARDGQVVKVAVTEYPGPGKGLEGRVEKVVGEPGDPLIEVLSVAYAAGFAEDFPAPVGKAADAVPDEVRAADREGRRDLRDLPLVTIDGEDARDFDDAVFVERRRGGYRLVVAIADVSHYVREGTALDEEALRRATSVYFPNHVLPMLPERLSNGICSLNPGVDRLCMVCDLLLDTAGRPQSAELYEGMMRSHARCTYAQVARVLAGEEVPELARVAPHLKTAGVLAKRLQARRAERGAIDFDLPEAKVVLDEHLVPVEVVKRERNDAHRLIEEFMLAANEAVARYFDELDLPTVYRVHGSPDPEKLETFATLARAQGFVLDTGDGITPKALNAFLRKLQGSRHQRALNSLLLRAMMQAVYSSENIGHFGLAAKHYLHFTSPIRRYPDLMVHRLLKEHWARGRAPGVAEKERLAERLDEVASISSERERAAMQAERDIDAYFKCVFVKDRVGERFPATVVAVTDFGFFAELDGTAVEGLVRAELLGAQWDLDLETNRLVFGRGISFGIGDRVEVQIASVNPAARRIDLVLVEALERAEPPRRPVRGRRRGAEVAEPEAPAFGVIGEAAAGGERRRRARPEPVIERIPRKPRYEAEPEGGKGRGGRRKLGAEPSSARLPPRRRPVGAAEAGTRDRRGKASPGSRPKRGAAAGAGKAGRDARGAGSRSGGKGGAGSRAGTPARRAPRGTGGRRKR